MAGDRVVPEYTQHGGGLHLGVLLFHAPHHHTEVLGLNNDPHSFGPGEFHHRIGNLGGEVFLNLQAPGKDIDDTRHFGQTNHFAVRDLGHVTLTDKRQHMVFTHGVQLDVLNNDHLAVIAAENSDFHDPVQVFVLT